MKHLLVTNDFPPKVGGIQAYLWELWRRMDPGTFAVLTASSDPGAAEFDRTQAETGVRIERVSQRVLLPTRGLADQIRATAERVGAGLVVIDPAFPLGVIGPSLQLPYAVLLHGAEVAVPGRIPGTRALLARTLRRSTLAVSAGGYPAAEGARAVRNRGMPPVVQIPPGVDLERFQPLSARDRRRARTDLGLPATGRLVVSVSRLVPRKGMDMLVDAAALLSGTYPDLLVAIAGSGRDHERLARRIVGHRAPVSLLGAVPDHDLSRLVGAADVFAMLCRNRWFGLEREGFGIVFLEAAAAGVASIAGDSGGAGEAVVDGETGIVVSQPGDARAVASALGQLLDDPGLGAEMGRAARQRVELSFDYDQLASRLSTALADVQG